MCADFCSKTSCCQAFKLTENVCELVDATGLDKTDDGGEESLQGVYMDSSVLPGLCQKDVPVLYQLFLTATILFATNVTPFVNSTCHS